MQIKRVKNSFFSKNNPYKLQIILGLISLLFFFIISAFFFYKALYGEWYSQPSYYDGDITCKKITVFSQKIIYTPDITEPENTEIYPLKHSIGCSIKLYSSYSDKFYKHKIKFNSDKTEMTISPGIDLIDSETWYKGPLPESELDKFAHAKALYEQERLQREQEEASKPLCNYNGVILKSISFANIDNYFLNNRIIGEIVNNTPYPINQVVIKYTYTARKSSSFTDTILVIPENTYLQPGQSYTFNDSRSSDAQSIQSASIIDFASLN